VPVLLGERSLRYDGDRVERPDMSCRPLLRFGAALAVGAVSTGLFAGCSQTHAQDGKGKIETPGGRTTPERQTEGNIHIQVQPDGKLRAGTTENLVDEIRKSGMTGAAGGDLRSVAELLAGVTVLRVSRDPRSDLTWIYAPSTWWVLPRDSSRELRLQFMTERNRLEAPEVRALIHRWIQYLKKPADADGSGFVSTVEGRILRRRIELGFVLSQVRTAPSIRELATLLGASPKQLAGDLTAYQKMRDAAIRDGMGGFPALPAGLLEIV
jgi:hypothetical protein